MVSKIKQVLYDNPAGVVSINVDGQTVQWDRKQALEELKMWEKRAAEEEGRRGIAASINLGGF